MVSDYHLILFGWWRCNICSDTTYSWFFLYISLDLFRWGDLPTNLCKWLQYPSSMHAFLSLFLQWWNIWVSLLKVWSLLFWTNSVLAPLVSFFRNWVRRHSQRKYCAWLSRGGWFVSRLSKTGQIPGGKYQFRPPPYSITYKSDQACCLSPMPIKKLLFPAPCLLAQKTNLFLKSGDPTILVPDSNLWGWPELPECVYALTWD